MAKKLQNQPTTTHAQCSHCNPVTHEFLNYNGEPILGECIHSETRFLLNEKIYCKQYK